MGGQQGLAGLLGRANHTRPFQVLLQGNSFLRQMFEALVFGFQSQITDLNLNIGVGGPSVSISSIGAHKGRLGIDELGDMINLPRAIKGGCHGGTSTLIMHFTSAMSQFRQPHQDVMATLEWLNLEMSFNFTTAFIQASV